MPSLTRLTIARDLTGEYEILAIDLDSKQQCGITHSEAFNFIPDLMGMSESAGAQYTLGYPVQAGMRSDVWALWLAEYELAQEDAGFVWLTCSQTGPDDDCISALCLTDGLEIAAPPAERQALLTDLIGFDPALYGQGYGTVCRMSSNTWQLWLNAFEVAALDDETAAMLSAI